MDFLYLLESIRCPVLDFFFETVTHLGEETLFLVISIVFFWCVNKREGYFILITGLFGTLLNQALKLIFRIPRPWVIDPEFTVVGDAKIEATGYSFPSGHTQNISTTFGAIAAYNGKKRWVTVISVAVILTVAFSRMYLGVHTPLDVGVSLLLAAGMIFLGYPLFQKAKDNPRMMYVIFSVLAVLMAAYLCFVSFYPFPESVYLPENIHNLESARKNGFTLMGCILGIFVIYTADIKWLKFETHAVWWAQILKAAGGLAVVLAAKELLHIPLDAILDENTWARLIRYFLVVIVGGLLWPMTFRYFSKLGKKGGNQP